MAVGPGLNERPVAPDRVSIERIVALAIEEDLGDGDVSARLVDPALCARATVMAREPAIICGRPWVDAVFQRFDRAIAIKWHMQDGESVPADRPVFSVQGPARSLLGAERSALNFLQTLSGTATEVRRYVDAVAGTGCAIVDTRKTLPGLRLAQKYAVRCGGGRNHRLGLYDAILIKENHIAAAGGIRAAIQQARALGAGVPLMTEAETLDEARVALDENVDLLLVDDFPLHELRQAVAWTRAQRASGGRTLIEYSGGATLAKVRTIAETGVDRVSIGALTKHVRAVDLSMRLSL